VFAFDRSVRLMQCGLFLLLMLLARFLRNYWRQPVFGIALGFGVFASVELILISIVMWFGKGQAATISLIKSAAYNTVTLVWIGYLAQQTQPATGVVQLNPSGMALAAPGGVSDHDEGFILMVEQAVDRVLSRSNWPRPTTKERWIIGRKPNSEEGN